MKNKKKILSLLACLSLLTSCNKSTPSSSSCKVTTSTPSVDPTPTPTPEKINIFDYANTSTITSTDDLSMTGTLNLTGFNNQLTDEMKLTIEEITIPEEINGFKLTNLYTNIFKGFDNLKKINISKNLSCISFTTGDNPTPFTSLPSLESIEVNSENEWFYSKGNCLILKSWNTNSGNRVLNGRYNLICGYKDIEIPDEITSIDSYSLRNNQSITSIKLNKNITSINGRALRYLNKLTNIDLNGNTNFIIEEGSNVLCTNDGKYNILTAWGDCIVPSNITKLDSFTTDYPYFSNTNVTSITIGSNVTAFATNTFNYCSMLKKIIFTEDSNFKEDSYFIINKNTNKIVSIYGNTYLTEIEVPNYITELPSIFYYFENLEKVTLNEGLISIGSGSQMMFNETKSKVKEIIIPSTVETITSSTFGRNTVIEKIDISNNTNLKYENGILFDKNNNKVIALGDVDLTVYDDLSNLKFDYDAAVTSIKVSKNTKNASSSQYSFISTCNSFKLNKIIFSDGDEDEFKNWTVFSSYLKSVDESKKKQITIEFQDKSTKLLSEIK